MVLVISEMPGSPDLLTFWRSLATLRGMASPCDGEDDITAADGLRRRQSAPACRHLGGPLQISQDSSGSARTFHGWGKRGFDAKGWYMYSIIQSWMVVIWLVTRSYGLECFNHNVGGTLKKSCDEKSRKGKRWRLSNIQFASFLWLTCFADGVSLDPSATPIDCWLYRENCHVFP